MKPTLSQVCSLNSPFRKDIEDYAAGQCRAIDLWLTKLEDYLQSHSLDEVQQLLDNCGITTRVASFQGGLLVSQGEARREAWQLFQRRLELCHELSVESLVVACDVAGRLAEQDVQRVHASLGQVAQEAERHAVRVALEFQARASLGNNLQTAAALVNSVASSHLGICLDVFHYYVGPSKPEDLGYLTRDNLFLVQLSDLAETPREFASDSERILPGDGDIPLSPIIEHLRAIDYAGPVSIELMNPSIWQIPALQFGEIGITALRKLLGQADRG